MGIDLLCFRVEPAAASDRRWFGYPAASGDRVLHGDDHLRLDHVGRQHGIRLT